MSKNGLKTDLAFHQGFGKADLKMYELQQETGSW